MPQSIIRWTIYLLCLLVLGPAAGAMTGALRAVDGGHAATPLVCAHPAAGLGAGLAAMLIALVVGLAAARLSGIGPGMSSAGLVLAWASWQTGTVDQLIRTAHSGEPLVQLAVEGLIFGIGGMAIAYMVWVVAKPEPEPGAKGTAARPVLPADIAAGRLAARAAATALIATFKGKGGAVALAVAVVIGGAAAWFIGVSPLKGQAIAAAVAAAAFGAAAGRLVEFTAPMPALFLAVAALAVLGPISGVVTAGSGIGAVQQSYAGTLFPLANICPLDWIAGGLLGIPLGVAWAGSMVEKRAE